MILTYLAVYDIRGIPDFWQKMSEESSNEFDIFSSHPADSKRIKQMYELIDELLNTSDIYHAPLLSEDFKKESHQNFNKNNQDNIQVQKIYTNRNYCPKCGSYSQSNRNFCGECGVQVIRELKCSKCGKISQESNVFCGECGSKFIN